MLAKTLIQPTPNTAVAKPAYTLRDAAPSHHAVEAVRAIKEVMARGPERRGAHEARDRDGAQRPVNNIIIVDRGPDAADARMALKSAAPRQHFWPSRLPRKNFQAPPPISSRRTPPMLKPRPARPSSLASNTPSTSPSKTKRRPPIPGRRCRWRLSMRPTPG